ncbi:MAG: DUF4097 family beta strand repeat protein [Sphingobacteriia bacterium]|nr:DUF4097 family beta strand repeat protein [Sphingobacteriia bacterium]
MNRSTVRQGMLAFIWMACVTAVGAQTVRTVTQTNTQAGSPKQKSVTKTTTISKTSSAPATGRVYSDVSDFPPTPPMPPMPPMEPMELSEGATFMEMGEGKQFTDKDDLKSKEVSQEIASSKTPDIFIDNTSRNIVIKTWDQPKVKVTTTVYFEGEGKLSDEEWFEKMNLSLKTMGGSVKIKSGNVGGGSYTFNGNSFGWTGQGGGVAVFSAEGMNIGTKSNTKRLVTIYIPAGSKLDVESKYADVQISGSLGTASIDLANGNLDAENFSKLMLHSKYSNVSVGNVAYAEIEFMNGRFSAKNLDDADLDTKYSTIEAVLVKKGVFRSTNDEYEFEEAQELRGRKNYGNMRITRLSNSLELDGTNADIKIRNIDAGASLIRVDNKYADIRLPLKQVKNFNIRYNGPFSSVYGNFERNALAEETKKTEKKDPSISDAISGRIAQELRFAGERNNIENRFTATGGDGKGLKIEMNCQNCTVDFK